ncbi:hypothetical protein [Streptomyces sp. NBC_00691]|uniref:hypothetical protein n=1 Tax=Streptomyces sp. NBC_00691 TaxID=2903671 RepID=UPI002E31FDCD|nr:hypothetical protein [Streptomyces sp. NBC_00691]
MPVELDSIERAAVQKYDLAWPEVDEDGYTLLTAGLSTFADSVDDDTWGANQHMQRLLSSGEGEAMNALREHWDRVRAQDLTPVAGAARALAAAVSPLTTVIAELKASVVAAAARMAADDTAALTAAAAAPGAPAAAAARNAILAQRANARYGSVVENLLTSLRSVLADPAVIALENVPDDLAGGAGGRGGSTGARWSEVFGGAGSGAEKGFGGSVGGGAAGGMPPGRAIGGVLRVDHEEHELAAGRIREIGLKVRGETTAELNAAVGDHGSVKSSGSFAIDLAQSVDLVLDRLSTATTAIGGHLSGALPDAILQVSNSQQDTDEGNRQRMAQLD